MATVFEIDAEGWREMNLGRPSAHLVREVVQNAFDEACTVVSVKLTWDKDGGAHLRVHDDVEGGIRDPSLVFTIWKSDKQDSPYKRGRMGRGLKELIAVADHTLVTTQNAPAIEFTRRRGGHWERTSPRKHRPEKGTVINAIVRAWRKRDVDQAIEYLSRMRPPEGVKFVVNGVEIARREASERYNFKLPTVVFVDDGDGRASRERMGDTAVDLFQEAESWVYEMGIPIEKIDYPMSIDVGQRVPLREKRDTLTDPYRRELLAKLLNVRLDKISIEGMRDNHVLIAAAASPFLSDQAKAKVAEAYTEGRPFAATNMAFSAATGQHIAVTQLRKLPESIRTIVREVGTDVTQVLAERSAAACSYVPVAEQTDAERRTAKLFGWIAANIGRSCVVQIVSGRPSCSASFDPTMRVLSLYRDVLGKAWFENPLSADALGLLCHELAHWENQPGDDSHGLQFHADSEHVGGAIAAFLVQEAEAELAHRFASGDPA